MKELILPEIEHVMLEGIEVANENPLLILSQNSTHRGIFPPSALVWTNSARKGHCQLSMQKGLQSFVKLSFDRI